MKRERESGKPGLSVRHAAAADDDDDDDEELLEAIFINK